ncbi:MAG: amidohydrolase family protein [Planctomycetota bacterium]|nr:amidohydrolase family protein [Planctomycetota bacterium]
MRTLLLAEWIAPMNRPPLHQAGVVFDESKILAVAPANTLRQQHPDATLIHAGAAIILPGLINAHTHLELSDCTRLCPPPDSFVQWLKGVISRTTQDPANLAPSVQHAISTATAQCLRFGVTTVADISRQCHLTRPLLRQSPLRVVSYGEVQAMAQRRDLLEPRLATAIDPTHASDRLRVALSPHAPYSIEATGYRRCLQLAKDHHLPLATHLAETPDEATFLANHSGPFRDLWDFLHAWDDRVPTFTAGPIRFAQSLGLLDHPTLLAHVNYCDDDELAILANTPATVVYCPRTHAYFKHPLHRFRQMLARGINVAVGTDSCASSPDLNLVDDLRLLHHIAPDIDPQSLWQLATSHAARAIAAPNLGVITPNNAADFVLFNTTTSDPLREILEQPQLLPTSVWIAGRQLTAE